MKEMKHGNGEITVKQSSPPFISQKGAQLQGHRRSSEPLQSLRHMNKVFVHYIFKRTLQRGWECLYARFSFQGHMSYMLQRL